VVVFIKNCIIIYQNSSMKKSTMSYVIACWKRGVPHGIQVTNNKFTLVPLDSQTNVSKLFNNPHRTQMQKFLNWIKENDKELKHEEFSIQDYGRFRR
jgi:hypothetical protein